MDPQETMAMGAPDNMGRLAKGTTSRRRCTGIPRLQALTGKDILMPQEGTTLMSWLQEQPLSTRT